MYVIGRNVGVKVQKGKVTIVCQTENIVPWVSMNGRRMVLAGTRMQMPIPGTDLTLTLTLSRRKTE